MSEQPGNPVPPPHQPPPSGHEPPPGSPPPAPPGPGGGTGSGGGNRRILFAVLAVLVLLVAGGVVAALLLTGDDDDDDSAGGRMSPVETVEAGLAALEAGDCEKAREYMPSLDESRCHALQPQGFDFGDPEEVSSTDEEAVVAVPILSEQQNGEAEAMVELELDDDRWVAVNLRLPEGLSTTPEPTCADESDPECDPESPPATSDDGSPESEPEQDPGAVAEQFVAAIEENDCEAAKEVYADPSTANCADLELDDQADITFGEFKGPFGGDDSAHVIVEMLGADGEKLPQVLQIHMVNDPERGWLVEGWNA